MFAHTVQETDLNPVPSVPERRRREGEGWLTSVFLKNCQEPHRDARERVESIDGIKVLGVRYFGGPFWLILQSKQTYEDVFLIISMLEAYRVTVYVKIRCHKKKEEKKETYPEQCTVLVVFGY